MDRRDQFGVGLLLGLLVALVVGLSLAGWPWNWSWDPDYNRAVTIKNFDRARGFEPNRAHAVCSVEKTSEGTAYTIMFNMSGGCRQTIEVTVPRDKVRVSHVGKHARANLTYNRVVYFHDYTSDGVLDWRSPNSGGKASVVKQMTSMSLGEMLKVDLRVVNLQLPTGYKLASSA